MVNRSLDGKVINDINFSLFPTQSFIMVSKGLTTSIPNHSKCLKKNIKHSFCFTQPFFVFEEKHASKVRSSKPDEREGKKLKFMNTLCLGKYCLLSSLLKVLQNYLWKNTQIQQKPLKERTKLIQLSEEVV